MPEIIIIDLAHVAVDGETVGNIFDVAWNRPQLEGVQGLMMSAVQSWLDARDKSHADAMDALRTGLSDASAAACADLQAKHAADIAARDAALADAVAAERERNKAALADLQSQHDAAITSLTQAAATLQSKITELEADVATKQNLINALGGTEAGQKLRDEARLKELTEARAKIEAQLADLDVQSSA